MYRIKWRLQKPSEYVELESCGDKVSVGRKNAVDKPWYRQFNLQIWRPVVWAGVATSAAVMAANIIVLIVGLSRPGDGQGTRILYEGECDQSSFTYSAWHILINILSTLLLSSSNAISQILAAPTRGEVDNAHAKGKYVHIGMLDILNLRYVNWKRAAFCALIAVSSVPLHLLYNSTIFNKTTAYDYYAILVLPDFVTGSDYSFLSWGTTRDTANFEYYHYPNLFGVGGPLFAPNPGVEYDVRVLRNQARTGSLTRLENRECILQFGKDTVSDASAVIVVTKPPPIEPQHNNSYVGPLLYIPPDGTGLGDKSAVAYGWICDNKFSCDARKEASESSWHVRPASNTLPDQPDQAVFEVDYCLVRDEHETCAINLSIYLMVAVVICNGMKLGCFLGCLTIKEHRPLVTVGDAVVSFMERPDPTTISFGTVSGRDAEGRKRISSWKAGAIPIKEHSYQDVNESTTVPDQVEQKMPAERFQEARPTTEVELANLISASSQPWKNQRQRYYVAASRSRWIASGTVMGALLLVGVVLLIVGDLNHNQGITPFRHGFRFSNTDILPGIFTLFSAVFCANILQLAVSNAYLLFNGIFTSILLSAELADFAREAKTMRVTEPRGAQRSTYWLQLPYKWSMPMMAVMALLHFLISEAIFMVDMELLDPNGHRMDSMSFYGLAWNAPASLCAVIEGALMIAFLFSNGFRRFPSGMPILSSNSLAISAACHPAPGEYGDAVLRPLKYGVLQHDRACNPQPTGFSAREVAPLQDGGCYGWTSGSEVQGQCDERTSFDAQSSESQSGRASEYMLASASG